MNILEIKDRTNDVINDLVKLWEESVKSSHLFLTEEEILNIKFYVPDLLKNIPLLFAIKNDLNNIVAFMGIENKKMNMLFISPKYQRKGLGKTLVDYAIKNLGVFEVSCNEQNTSAKNFYLKMGFVVYKRTKIDEQGNNYPILYMKLNNFSNK